MALFERRAPRAAKGRGSSEARAAIREQNLAARLHKHGKAYFQVITTPGIEPTNNRAERAIRFVVIDRRVTQGTRSETGRHCCERIRTTIATCEQQGRSVFASLLESVEAHLRGVPPPSLLPSGS